MIASRSPVNEYEIFRHAAIGPILKSRVARCGNGGIDRSRHVEPVIFRYLPPSEFAHDRVELFGAQISKRPWLDVNGPSEGWFAAPAPFQHELPSFAEAPQFICR